MKLRNLMAGFSALMAAAAIGEVVGAKRSTAKRAKVKVPAYTTFGHLSVTFNYSSIYHARRKSRRNKSPRRFRACR